MSLAALPRISAARMSRVAVLATIVMGYLPVPVVHAHSASCGAIGTVQLERHLALFHAGQNDSADRGLHVHFVPGFFLVSGGASDATGTNAPESSNELVCAAPVFVDLDSAMSETALADLPVPTPPPTDRSRQPFQFLQTYACSGGMTGLIGVCLC